MAWAKQASLEISHDTQLSASNYHVRYSVLARPTSGRCVARDWPQVGQPWYRRPARRRRARMSSCMSRSS